MSRGLIRTVPLAFSRGLATANEPYDVAIIGGGPAGYVAAIKSAQLGLKVGNLPFLGSSSPPSCAWDTELIVPRQSVWRNEVA